MDGTTLARRARELRPDLPVIYTSGQSTIDQSNAVEGAMFVSKPYDLFDVGRLIETSHGRETDARVRVAVVRSSRKRAAASDGCRGGGRASTRLDKLSLRPQQ